jgi:mono/diheme cytochrome c family protein
MKHLALSVLLAALVGCGTPPPPATPDQPSVDPVVDPSSDPGADPGSSDPVADAAPASWEAMTREQRMEQMNEVVLPTATKLFQSFDADRYKKVTCATCHGPGVAKGEFDLPSADLPKLTMPSGEGEPFADEMKAHPEMTKFMMTQLTPKMVEMLPGVSAYDPATQKGFGCFGCHTAK